MSVRLTWTNNSSGHDGTYVYRSTSTMDPQALPAPIADLPAGSEEYVDGAAEGGTTYHYRIQDNESGQVSSVSDEISIFAEEDYGNAQIGDYIGGGVYAGTHTIDGTDYHIIFGDQSSETSGVVHKTENTATPGTLSDTDGLSNTLAMQTEGLSLHPAADYCLSYSGGGYTDWYFPAIDELSMESNLRGHPELSDSVSTPRISSTEHDDSFCKRVTFQGSANNGTKASTSVRMRPVRRIAA